MVQLRGNLTKKMEDNAGSVRFRRWKAMGWGSRLSLIVLALIILIAVFAEFIAPYDPYAMRARLPTGSSCSAPTTRAATCSPE